MNELRVNKAERDTETQITQIILANFSAETALIPISKKPSCEALKAWYPENVAAKQQKMTIDILFIKVRFLKYKHY